MQVLATSVVLLLIGVAIAPGLSYCAISSVTSYNNYLILNDNSFISISTGNAETKPASEYGNGAVEIISNEEGSSSFPASKNGTDVKLVINGVSKYLIYLKISNGNNASFRLNILGDIINVSGNKTQLSEGYLKYIPNTTGQQNGILVKSGGTEISSGDVEIIVTGESTGADIHMYIIPVNEISQVTESTQSSMLDYSYVNSNSALDQLLASIMSFSASLTGSIKWRC